MNKITMLLRRSMLTRNPRTPLLSLVVKVATTLLMALSHSVVLAEPQTAEQQVADSLKLISELDREFKAVTAIDNSALQQAQNIDAKPTTLLGGMTILVKDNIDVSGMATTAGSLALNENFPAQDAPLVAQLKRQGAVILGKANLSEWANFRSEKSSSGWSAVGGQTRNAIDPTRTPCGSSAGSAVAVALGYVKVAIGTETNGSIVCPASANGVVGFKPTHGIVSGEGIVPLALTQDTAGPIANSIENAALALSAMIDPAAKDAETLTAGLQDISRGPALKGMKIGVLASNKGYDARRDAQLDKAINLLKKSGVEIVDDLALDTPSDFWADAYQVLLYEFKRDLAHYFSQREYRDAKSPLKKMTLAKLIQFNNDNTERQLKHFDQSIFEKSQALELSDEEYQTKLAALKLATRENGLDKLFNEHSLDAIIGITVGPAWKIDHVNGDAFFGPSMSTYPAVGGHPHVTVPHGQIVDLPVGLSFVGKRHQDHKLAQLVYQFVNSK